MHLRSVDPERDYAAIAALINLDAAEPYTVEQVRHWLREEPGRIYRVKIAADEARGGEMIGYSEVVRQKWYEPGSFEIWAGVYPERRCQGVGGALYEDAEAYARTQGAENLRVEVLENDAASLRFATRRGFTIDRLLFESTLNLETFDETPFVGCIPALNAAGIRFCSLADFGNSLEARRKLYEVNRITALQIPGYSGAFTPWEDFDKEICGSDWFRPAGQLLAMDGDACVALSAVRLYPDSGGSYNLMTGVLPEYRGRKIALALKLLAIRYARASGARTMRTHNDSLNAPMLAINRKLGYQPQSGKYVMRKKLF